MSASRPPAFPLFLIGSSIAACMPIVHLERNAPGNIHIEKAPEQLSQVGTKVPDDPGEQDIVIAGGGFVGGGGTVADGGNAGLLSLGVETSLFYGLSAQSHAADDWKYFANESRRAFGLNLGWHLLDVQSAPHATGIGAGYLEAQYHQVISEYGVFGAAAGYSWHPRLAIHGPQGTLFWNLFFVRVLHLFDKGTDIVGGLIVKWRAAWVWSR